MLLLPEIEKTKISELTVDDMSNEYITESDIWGFLEYLTSYNKKFIKKDGEETVQNFTNSKKGKSRKLASIRMLYKYLGRKYKIQDPTKYVEISIKKKKKIKERLSEKDISLLLSTIVDDIGIDPNDTRLLKRHKQVKLRDLTMLMLLAFTGIRISELIQLDISDVSIVEEAMIIERKGGDQEKIGVPDEIIPQISEYIEWRKKISMEDIPDQYKDALFLSNQKKRMHSRSVSIALNKYAVRSNLDVKVTPHTFRRTFATQLLELYGNIELVAEVLGHSTVETTRKFYAEMSDESKKIAMKGFKYNDKKR
jgi:integrase/recombinase XerC